MPGFPLPPQPPPTSRNISIDFQSLLALNIKFCLLFLRPKYLHDAIRLPTSASSLCPLCSLDRQELFVPRTTIAMSRSYSVIGPSLWNHLPPSARASLLQPEPTLNLSTSLSLLKTLFS